MADVFISYSRHDSAFVHELHDALTTSGRDVWVDWEDIPPASRWEQDIDDSIDAAESFVFVVSTSSLASEYCATELEHAQKRGKRIVPIACDGADPGTPRRSALRQLNWIWCRESDDRDAAFDKLSSALDTDLEWARAHTRLLVRAVEWDARQDGACSSAAATSRGRARLAANAAKEPPPTELQQRYVHASRRGAARRQRSLLGGVLVALVVSLALGVVAVLQRDEARRATTSATSIALASASGEQLALHPDVALLLGLDAVRDSADGAGAGQRGCGARSGAAVGRRRRAERPHRLRRERRVRWEGRRDPRLGRRRRDDPRALGHEDASTDR